MAILMINADVEKNRPDIAKSGIEWLKRAYASHLITTSQQTNGDVWYQLEGGQLPYGNKVIRLLWKELVPNVLAFQVDGE